MSLNFEMKGDFDKTKKWLNALKTNKINVVLHMEQNKHFIDPADILSKLKQQIKAVDSHPKVVNQANLKTSMRWKVL